MEVVCGFRRQAELRPYTLRRRGWRVIPELPSGECGDVNTSPHFYLQ